MKSKLQQTLEKRSKVITAELMPPRGGSPIRSLKIAQLLKDKVHAVNITDGSRAVMRMCSLAMSKLLLENGIEPVMQISCRDRNKIALQSDILGANALGIRNILCITGDSVKAGDQQDAKAVHEFESVRLLWETLNSPPKDISEQGQPTGDALFAIHDGKHFIDSEELM